MKGNRTGARWNLLREPLLRVWTTNGAKRMNLPELLEALGRDEVEHYQGIQQHQEDALHVFLSYLAGAILARNDLKNPVQAGSFWFEGMMDLTRGIGDDVWSLVVHDLTRPAFMQPPIPLEDQKRLKPVANGVMSAQAVDAVDLLVTSKNHDVKSTRAVWAKPDMWFYTLISLQTMSGFSGRGKYGISRMNSGYGNRPIVEILRSLRPGHRWRDAVVRLLDHRRTVLSAAYGFDPEGLVLLWLEPWDGDSSLSFTLLDPFYIEICRRVRLKDDAGHVYAADMPTKSNRVAARDLKGVVGDAWLPIDLGDGKSKEPQALTISPEGLTPRILRRIIFGDQLQHTALQEPLPEWQDSTLWLSVSVLVRGQGKTDGFHEQRIAIPPKAQSHIFGPPERREPFAQLSRIGLEYAGAMENRVLKPAVFLLLQGGGEKVDYDSKATKEWWRGLSQRFSAYWSDGYFPWLWSVSDPSKQDMALRDWVLVLKSHALEVMRYAEETMPRHSGRWLCARSRAELAFSGFLYNQFPLLKEVKHAESTP